MPLAPTRIATNECYFPLDIAGTPTGPRMTPPNSIAIIGAGLGGLTAALALLRAGWRVRVY